MSDDLFVMLIERMAGFTLEGAFVGFCETCNNAQHRDGRHDYPRHLALSYANGLVQVISVKGVGFTHVRSFSAIGLIKKTFLAQPQRGLWTIGIRMAHGHLHAHADWSLTTHPVIDISTLPSTMRDESIRWAPVMNGDTHFGELAHRTKHVVDPA
jgi:hypothetical protein